MTDVREPDRSDDFFRSVGGQKLVQGGSEAVWYFGWIPRNNLIERFFSKKTPPLFGDAAPDLVGSGAGKTVLLYEAARKVMGRDLDLGPQRIGDCVGWGFAGCVDLLACVEALADEAERYAWEMRAATEAIYALSRVEYGQADGSYDDGSTGRWAASAVRLGGTLSRQRLGPYDPERAKSWGASGLPDDLEPAALEHRVLRTALVTSFEEARDAIASGYPVAVCSNQGFAERRDGDGFDEPSGVWNHCMKFIASKDDERPGLLCMNSWGPGRVGGPKGKHDIPDSTFWVEADVCTRMLRQGDSYALASFEGYQARHQLIAELLGEPATNAEAFA